MKYLLVVLVALFVGCDKTKLVTIEEASKDLKLCQLNQILPDHCVEEIKDLELAELKATQSGIDSDKIYASRRIGEKTIAGDTKSSPYNRVKRSLERRPFYIVPDIENFDPYTISCPDFNFDTKDNIDIDELMEALSWSLRPAERYQAVSYFQVNNGVTYIFSKTPVPCRPEKYLDINDEFPIITETQLKELKDGRYHRPYSKIETLVFDNFDEAREKYLELTANKR